MLFSEIYEKLEVLAPKRYALNKDSTGFQVGRWDKEVKRVYLATDIMGDVVEQAVAGGADLVLTHHPLIYGVVAKIVDDDIIGRRIIKLIQNDINYMAMHTNFDVMGMADYAADILGLNDREVLWVTFKDECAKEGIGRVGCLPKSMNLYECANYVKTKFRLDSVRVFGDKEKNITKAAISPGSSSDILPYAIKAGVDVLITGDIKHSMALYALAHGIDLIDAGHYGTEQIFVSYLTDYFNCEIPELEIFRAKEENPFWVQ